VSIFCDVTVPQRKSAHPAGALGRLFSQPSQGRPCREAQVKAALKQ
jgi:hypothetical protein